MNTIATSPVCPAKDIDANPYAGKKASSASSASPNNAKNPVRDNNSPMKAASSASPTLAASAAASLAYMASLTAHIESFDYQTHAAELERRRQETAQRMTDMPPPPPLVCLPAESLAAYHGPDDSDPASKKKGPKNTKSMGKTKTNPSKSSGSKRKATIPQVKAGDRVPQRRFIGNGGDEDNNLYFRSKKDQRIPLTTNNPRQVEAIDPTTKARVRLFASCSAASRDMNINRTRMSRTCRSGGGTIHAGSTKYFYRYVGGTETSTASNATTEDAEGGNDTAPDAEAKGAAAETGDANDTSTASVAADDRDDDEGMAGSTEEDREAAVTLIAL